ncbi:response regulator transcription factor [Sphingobacterium siyangense]|uniref:response regulator transcription factor n=1 Tax=Sphingobacterium siyangense TaxID=459529 RepID=UPI0031F91FF5
MQIGCTEMHPIILGVIIIELILLGAQWAYYLERPLQGNRIWFILFLLLLLLLNIINGFFPNPILDIPLYLQYIFRNGLAFLTIAYFPFQFFKKLQIIKKEFTQRTKIHFLLILPYPIVFLITYSAVQDLEKAHRYSIFVPGFNNLIMITLIGKAIWNVSKKKIVKIAPSKDQFALIMLISWLFIYPGIHLNWGKAIETVIINLGPTAFNAMLLFNCIKTFRYEQELLLQLNSYAPQEDVIILNCRIYMLSDREKEIAILLCYRLKRQQVADKLFISVRTVDKHVERIFLKTGVSTREKLLEKLNKLS